MDSTASPRTLPPGFQSLRVLVRTETAEVHHARGPTGEVALRILGTSANAPGRAELGVLASVDHEGLARLVDFDQVATSGDLWLAREWIDGTDLRTWAARHSSEELGALVAELCSALQHLHERGFVHADIKPENIIVDDQDRPHLTDFGLSRTHADEAQVSGSLFYIAPEVLLGGNREVATDLFSLGVLLHALILRPDVSAAHFYGRFPSEDFFDSTHTQVADLPEWARGLVAGLLERDPTRRPGSAWAVESELRTRLALPARQRGTDLRRHTLRWSPLAGREDWLAERLSELPRSSCLTLPATEDAFELAQALHLWMALRNVPAVVHDTRAQAHTLDLTEVAKDILDPSGARVVLVPIAGEDQDAWRGISYLLNRVRAAQSWPVGQGARVLVISDSAPPTTCDLDARWEWPALPLATLQQLLQLECKGDVHEVVRVLLDASAGSLSECRRRVQSAFRQGEIVLGPDGPTLRASTRPESWGAETSVFDSQTPPAGAELEILSALQMCASPIALDPLREIVHVEEVPFVASLGSLIEAGLVRWAREQNVAGRVELAIPAEERIFDELDASRLQAQFARYAAHLERQGLETTRASLARYAAQPSKRTFDDVLAELEKLTEAWRPELSLQAALEFERHAARFAPSDHERAEAEVALAWTRLGQFERSEEVLSQLELASVADDAVRATLERTRGIIAHERHEYALAATHLERARALNPNDHGENLYHQVMLAWDRRDEEALDQLWKQAESDPSALSFAFRWNVNALRGLSLCRRGSNAEGLELLEAQLKLAIEQGDRAREAKSRLNIATAVRRGAGAKGAVMHLRRAAQIQEEDNHLPALAQVRAMLGGTLRSEGELREANELLQSAYDLRQRLGDESGATAARGMLGLVLADRGHLRAALDALESSARTLRATHRSADAALLEARALELRARTHSTAPKSKDTQEPDGDPRILISHARAAAMWNDLQRAREYAQRARDMATRLNLTAIGDEAEFLLRALAGAPLQDARVDGGLSRVAAEQRAWHFVNQPAAELDVAAASATCRDLASRGYVDLAARIAMRLTAFAQSDADAQHNFALARDWQQEVEAGLTEEQAYRARRTLLGLPDPRPKDIDAYERALSEGGVLDMDVITLLDINHKLVSQDDLHVLLGEIVESALSVTHAERGFLVLEHEGEFEFDTARHSRRGNIVDPEVEVSSSILRQVFESGTSLRLSNASDDPLLSGAPSVEQLELRSILVTPFTVDEQLRGVIYVDHRLKEGAFTERAERMLDLLSGQAALAIRQVRRLEEIRTLNGQLKRRVHDREEQLARAKHALEQAGARLPVSELVGSSAAMKNVIAMLERVAPAALPVLVCGASGTGKELAARALHHLSARSDGPFVVENCAALPPSLIESELFGYKKGAFTGADRDRAGIFERANGGTLFLDEIGELPIELQAKLLRVLETGELRRVGGTELIRTDFRLVAATNRDLAKEVQANRFRADLMYRLDALRIEMPKLSQRVEDIPELVSHFLGREEAVSGIRRGISRSVLAALGRRDWPGNVRELSNEISRLCVLSTGDIDDPALIRPPAKQAPSASVGDFDLGAKVPSMAELERAAIHHALRETRGDKRKAAKLLGISRAKLYGRLKSWNELDTETEQN